MLGSARVAVTLFLGLGLLIGGGAYAAYRWDSAASHRLMPGVEIGGVDVGEMTRAQAIAELTDRASARLEEQIEIVAGGDTWTVTAAELGTASVVEPVVDRALAVNAEYSWPDRVFRRLFNRSVGHASELRYATDPTQVRSFLEGVATEVAVDPTDAGVGYVDGELQLQKPELGQSLRFKEALHALRKAVAQGETSIQLPVERVQPQVTRDDLGYTIVVDISDLELSLFDGVRLTKTYDVAAGSPSYPTPQGEWTIINKRLNPTWVNPAPDGWGKSMPASIGPGPGNPLGTRALDLDAPGIRIHGTSASYSIGSYASHGCVRMLMPEVEELFDIVPIGTAVHIVP